MNHKRMCVHLAVEMAKIMQNNFGDEMGIDMDTLIAGAIHRRPPMAGLTPTPTSRCRPRG